MDDDSFSFKWANESMRSVAIDEDVAGGVVANGGGEWADGNDNCLCSG